MSSDTVCNVNTKEMDVNLFYQYLLLIYPFETIKHDGRNKKNKEEMHGWPTRK